MGEWRWTFCDEALRKNKSRWDFILKELRNAYIL